MLSAMGELILFPIDRASKPEPEPARELLWRELVGHELRTERLRQGRTQGDVAEAAGVSVQYLSEIERGRKEPSSEILSAVGLALGLHLIDLTSRATQTLTVSSPSRPLGPTAFAAGLTGTTELAAWAV